MMFFDGYIGAPPTSTVISAKAAESAAPPSAARLIAAANAASRTVNIQFLLQTWCRRAAGGSDEPRLRHLVRAGLLTGNYGSAPQKLGHAVWRRWLVDPATSTFPRGIPDSKARAGVQSRFYDSLSAVLGMTPTDYRAGGANAGIRFAIGECSLGSILVARSERGVCAILMGDDPVAGARARDLGVDARSGCQPGRPAT